MVGCSLVFFLMFFLSLTVLQAQQALHVVSFVVPEEIREFKQFAEVLSFDDVRGNTELRDLLEEMMVRYYIEMRYTMLADFSEMQRRWGSGGAVWRLSSPKVFRGFAINEEKLQDLCVEKKVTQTVRITSVKKEVRGVYSVLFNLTRIVSGKQTEKKMKVSLGYTYANGYRIFRSDFVNPYGLVFVGFDATEVK